MKKMFVILTSFFLLNCSGSSQDASNQTRIVSAPTQTPQNAQQLKATDVLQALKNANIPINSEVIYTEETDENKLLNRPNQYVEKISWNDKRTEIRVGQKHGTVETFKTTEDLENRKRYVEAITKSAPVFSQYIYAHKNVLLRLENELLPKQAAEYEVILKSL